MARKQKATKTASDFGLKPEQASLLRRELVGTQVPASICGEILVPVLGEKYRKEATRFAADAMRRMEPRDAVEEMLIAQLLLVHARVQKLTALTARQTNLDAIRIMNEYADRASNSYRRLMLALGEYRRPPRSGDTFAVVKQVNLANQQVVQNHENTNGNATNEQGSVEPAATADGQPAALPADTGRPEVPSFLRPPREAVEAIHRPAHSRRKGSLPDERDQAR